MKQSVVEEDAQKEESKQVEVQYARSKKRTQMQDADAVRVVIDVNGSELGLWRWSFARSSRS